MARKLVKVQKCLGRSSDLYNLFIADEKDWAWIKTWCEKVYNEAHFGEIAGKHSEVRLTFALKDFQVISEDEDFIDQFEKVVGKSFGIGVLGHLCNRCIECGDNMPQEITDEEYCHYCKEATDNV